MATATDNSDLLILPEEDTLISNESEINQEVTPSTEDIITFDDLSSNENALDINKVEDIEITPESFDLNSDSNITEESLVVNEESLEKNEKQNDTDFDFGDLGAELSDSDTKEVNNTEALDIEEVQESSLEKNIDMFGTENLSIDEKNTVGTMEDILEKAILDSKTRKDIISKDREGIEENISDLKAQIEDLEAKVITANEQVSELNSEESMIDKNIKSFERMKKVNPTTELKTETSKKVHNTKRKAA